MVRALLAVILVLLALPAHAATRVELELAARELVVGQTARLTVSVQDARPDAVPRVHAPDGLQIEFLQSSDQTYMVNFDVTRIRGFTYRVTALKEGTWTIGPVDVPIDARTLQTRAVEVTVRPRPAGPEATLSVAAGFDTDTAWEGQVVVYHYGLQARVPVLRSQWTLPPLEGLVVPRDGGQDREEYTIDDAGGRHVIDRTYLPLVAAAPGDRTQPGAVARVDVPVEDARQDFFGRFTRSRTEVLATEQSPLRVKPLPAAPPGFTGLVGDFEVEGTLSQTEAQVGASIEWTVRIIGDGALEGLALAPMAEVQGARAYDGSPSSSAELVDGRYRAEGRLTRVIVPTEEGTLELPPIRLVTFSPTRGAYVTHEVEAPPIVVTGGGDAAAGAVESFAKGIVAPEPSEAPGAQEHDIRDIRAYGPGASPRWERIVPLAVIAAGAPGVGVLTWWFFGLLWWRWRPAKAVAREVTPMERLAHLPPDRDGRLAALDAALRHALARRSGVEVSALERAAATAALPPDLRTRVTEVTGALDRARFADAGSADDLEERVRDLVQTLEPA